MTASPARVAARHLATTLSPAILAAKFQRLDGAVRGFERQWAPIIEAGQLGMYERKAIVQAWAWIDEPGRDLVRWVLETRAIPPGKAKSVELMARSFLEYEPTRPPRKIDSWWTKSRDGIHLLLETQGWPEKSLDAPTEAGVQEVQKVGPFTVHNTVHLEGKKLASTLEVIEQATAAVSRAGSKASRVLYGDIRVVGRLLQPKSLAWYFVKDDEVYLRPHPKVGRGEVHNLVHELGHRFEHKFLTKTEQAQWMGYYLHIRRTSTTLVKLPEVGKPVPIALKDKSTPTITGYEDSPKGQMVMLSDGGFLYTKDMLAAMEDDMTRAVFPTPYAASSPSEFFAETFAMHVLGTLPVHWRGVFEKVLPGAL